MKKNAIAGLIILFILLDQAYGQPVSELLDGYSAYNRFSGSVLVARDGKIIFQGSYGYADMENGKKNDAGTLFSLASVTKTLTASAIMKLHDEGRLSIYDRVDKYIPGFLNDNTDSLTIINLLNHTSGMVANIAHRDDYLKEELIMPDKDPVTLEQLVGKFRNTKLKSKPGTRFAYNNYGYSLLAYIIEKVTGMDYLTYLNREIFPVAGMSGTFSQLNLPPAAAKGYTGLGTGNFLPCMSHGNPSWGIGAAGLYSSPEDIYRFLEAVFTDKLFSEKTLKLMLDTCVPIQRANIMWALGWERYEVNGKIFYSHGGSIEGFSTRAGYVPEEKLYVVVLSNLVRENQGDEMSSVNFSFVDNITDEIIRLSCGEKVLCLPLPEGKPNRKIAGKYELDDNHFLSLHSKNDSLFVTTETGKFTVFDYNFYRDITDTSGCYKVCRIFSESIAEGNLAGFERFATDDMKKGTFNKEFYATLTSLWDRILSEAGKYYSSNIYGRIENPGHTDYYQAYHFEKAELIMLFSFAEDGLINGFFVLKLIPRCNVFTVTLVPLGKDKYFIDGYRYGGFQDFRVNYDRKKKGMTFTSDKSDFTAYKTN